MKNETQLPLPNLDSVHQSRRRLRRPISFAGLRRLLVDSDFDLGASFVIRHSSLVILSAGLSLLSACTVTSYTSPSGEKFTRSSLGANTSLRRVELHGYQNDSAQALGAVTEAAVRGAIQGVK